VREPDRILLTCRQAGAEGVRRKVEHMAQQDFMTL